MHGEAIHNPQVDYEAKLKLPPSHAKSYKPFVIRPHEKICLFPVSRPTPSKWGRVHFFLKIFLHTSHQCERTHVVPTSSYVMEEQKVGRSASVIVVFRFLFHQTFSTC